MKVHNWLNSAAPNAPRGMVGMKSSKKNRCIMVGGGPSNPGGGINPPDILNKLSRLIRLVEFSIIKVDEFTCFSLEDSEYSKTLNITINSVSKYCFLVIHF